MSNIPLMIVCIYILILIVISLYSSRLIKGTSLGFLLANREWPYWMVAAMLTGLAVGGASTLGCAQSAYDVGLSAGWYDVAWAFGALLMGFFGASVWRKMNITTIPEMLGNYYTDSSRIIGVLVQFIIVMVVTCLQFVAGGALLSVMLPQYFSLITGMILTAVIFVGISLTGGLWAGGLANLLNVVVIWVGVTIGMFASWSKAGGTSIIISNLPKEIPYFSLFKGLGFGVLLAWFIVMATQCFSMQAVEQTAFAAKDGKEAKKGFILAALIMAPLGFFSAYIGIAAKSLYPNIPSVQALPTIIMSIGPWLAGLVLSGLWAADISTGVSLLIGSSTLIERDLYEWSLERKNIKVDVKKALNRSRIIVLFLGVLGFFMALGATSILKTLLIGLSLTAPFTIIFLFTAYLPKFCKKSAAFWTIFVGTMIVICWGLFPGIRVLPHPIYLEWIICLPLFVIICLIDKAPINLNLEKVK